MIAEVDLARELETLGDTAEGGAMTVAHLWTALFDPSAAVRVGAIRGLALFYGRTRDAAALVCVDKLREIGLTDPSKAVRDEAVFALVIFGGGS